MATLNDLLKQMADSVAVNGMKDIGGIGDRQSNAQQEAAKLAWARSANPSEILGRIAGMGARQLFDNWKENYDARGDLKNMIATKGAQEAQNWINGITAKNPKQGAYLQEIFNRQFPQSNADTGQAAPDTTSTAWQTALQLADRQNPSDWLGQNAVPQAPYFGNKEQAISGLFGGNNPLTQGAANYDFSEMLKGANSPEIQELARLFGYRR